MKLAVRDGPRTDRRQPDLFDCRQRELQYLGPPRRCRAFRQMNGSIRLPNADEERTATNVSDQQNKPDEQTSMACMQIWGER